MHNATENETFRWYQSPAGRRQLILGVGCLILIGIVIFVGALIGARGAGVIAGPLIGALLIASGTYLFIVGRRAGIGVRSSGVTVRPIMGRAQSIPWAEIEKFDFIVPQM